MSEPKIVPGYPVPEPPTLADSERLRRLELALADLILYTHTLCQDLRADVGTAANARMFQRAKNNTQAFAIAIGAELAREGVTLCPKNVKLDEHGNGGGPC